MGACLICRRTGSSCCIHAAQPTRAIRSFSNELWVILDTTASFPRSIQLVPEDVRVAQWVRPYTISYSTANPTTDGAGWRAYNDLYLIQLDPEIGGDAAGHI